MKHLVSVLFALLSLNALGQIPEYVPTDGLVGWYPLDGTAENFSESNADGSLNGPVAAPDRFGLESSSLAFDGVDDWVSLGDLNPISEGISGHASYSFWIKTASLNSPDNQVVLIGDEIYQNNGVLFQLANNYGFGAYVAGSSNWDGYCSCFPTPDEWQHVVFVQGENGTDLYLDGQHLANLLTNVANNETTSTYRIGGFAPVYASRFFEGNMDDLGIWNRALNPEEIIGLFQTNALVEGCTDSSACNFNPEATEDDGSCLSVQIETSALEVCEGESITAQAFVNSVLASFDENYATVNETGAMLVVPTEYESVQAALSASAEGDTILVMPGQYVGTYDFPQTHGVHLISAEGPSETVLDGNNSESVIAINGEFEYSVKGFTITRGRAFQYSTICNGKMGGGMEICGANTVVNVEDNFIVDNAGMHRGGGIRVASPNCIVRRNVIAFNTMPYGWATYDGGAGVCIQASDITFENNTVAFNNDSGGYPYGAGVHMNDVEGGSFRNNIIFHNQGGPAMWRDAEAIVPIEFCNLDQDISGEGNLNADPLFVDAENNDFHLNEASPCIDAGHPSVLDADGTVSDLGALPFYQASAGLGVNLVWSTGDTTSTIQFQPQESTTLEVQATLNGVTCSKSTEITVHSNGCADEEACNFNADDFCSITCVYPLLGNDCEAGAVACATGTVWDAMTQTCVIATLPYLNEPGELAELNPCYFDTNFNGLVEVTDLMNLLSVYSMSCAWEE